MSRFVAATGFNIVVGYGIMGWKIVLFRGCWIYRIGVVNYLFVLWMVFCICILILQIRHQIYMRVSSQKNPINNITHPPIPKKINKQKFKNTPPIQTTPKKIMSILSVTKYPNKPEIIIHKNLHKYRTTSITTI